MVRFFDDQALVSLNGNQKIMMTPYICPALYKFSLCLSAASPWSKDHGVKIHIEETSLFIWPVYCYYLASSLLRNDFENAQGTQTKDCIAFFSLLYSTWNLQENGQRKYGGPPPGWDAAPPERGCEIFIGKLPRDLFEDELIPLCEKVSLKMIFFFNLLRKKILFSSPRFHPHFSWSVMVLLPIAIPQSRTKLKPS